MTYREWYEQYVSGDERALANEKRFQQDKRVEKSSEPGILSDTDIRAIQDYMTSNIAYSLNDMLRTGAVLTETQENFVRDLDAALAKLPDYAGIVYRSVSTSMIDDPAAFLAQYQEGELIRFPAYTSTSKTVHDPNMEIQYVIISKHGKDISSINTNEREVLFQRRSYFRVTRRDGNKIWMEEV